MLTRLPLSTIIFLMQSGSLVSIEDNVLHNVAGSPLVVVTYDDFHSQLKKHIDSWNLNPYPEGCTTSTYVDNVLHNVARRLLPNSNFTTAIDRELKKCNEELFENVRVPSLWACDEDWYSCYCYLKFLDTKGNSPISTTNNLLTDILINVWGMIYKAIQKLSDSTYPTSHLTLRELLEVGNVL